jgi:hypothetical protein
MRRASHRAVTMNGQKYFSAILAQGRLKKTTGLKLEFQKNITTSKRFSIRVVINCLRFDA